MAAKIDWFVEMRRRKVQSEEILARIRLLFGIYEDGQHQFAFGGFISFKGVIALVKKLELAAFLIERSTGLKIESEWL